MHEIGLPDLNIYLFITYQYKFVPQDIDIKRLINRVETATIFLFREYFSM